jgi:FMN phosphatase YigB (HAD superfamily)
LLSDVRRSGLCFDGVYSSQRLQSYKPHPDFYRRLIESIDIDPNHMVFVGDSLLEDIVGPSAFGIPSIFLNRFMRAPSFGQIKVHAIIDALNELPTIMRLFDDSKHEQQDPIRSE